MKTLLIRVIAFTLLNIINVNAQNSNDSLSQRLNSQPIAYTQYLKKSHDQKVTAIVLGIGGSLMFLTGISAISKGFLTPNAQHNNYGSVLLIGGAMLIMTSIPFSLASRKNKKMARLYIDKEKVMILPQISATVKLTCIGIKVNL